MMLSEQGDIKLFLSPEHRFKRPKAYNDNEGSMEKFSENLIIDENSDVGRKSEKQT